VERNPLNMDTPIWVLTYLHDWDPDGKVYPEVHTYCFETEMDALTHLMTLSSRNKYHIHKTWLQKTKKE